MAAQLDHPFNPEANALSVCSRTLDQLNLRQAPRPLRNPIPVPPDLIATSVRIGGIGARARNELILPLHLQSSVLAESEPGSQHARGRERVRHGEADGAGDVGDDVHVLITVGVGQEVGFEGEMVTPVEEEGLGIGFAFDFADPGGFCEMETC